MKFAVPILLAVFAVIGVAVVGAGDDDMPQALGISIPHGFPQFAIVAKIDDDGQRVTIYQQPNRPGSNIILDSPPETKARAYTIGGRELNPNALRKRLSHNSVVVISTDGKFPSREYRQYLKSRTVVFVFRANFLSSPAHQLHILLVPEQTKKKSTPKSGKAIVSDDSPQTT